MKKIDRIRNRFVKESLEIALKGKKGNLIYDRKADGDFEAHLIALSCSEPPLGFSRWSLRLLAGRAIELNCIDSVSQETMRRVLKNIRTQALKAQGMGDSPGAKTDVFVANMEMLLDICRHPYNPGYPVVCMDKSPGQLIPETRTRCRRPPGARPDMTMNTGVATYAPSSWQPSRLREIEW